jgi:protocatechuate 3,4-dioxygenase beta subunit
MIKNIATFIILLFSISPKIATCQNTGSIINSINQQLKQGKTTITKILTTDSLMYLHSLTPFREVIKANAKAEKIKIVNDKEPGLNITVNGLVVNKNGDLQKNVLIYFYQTSDRGWYSDTGVHILMNSGDINHARLFGYLKTNEQGNFSFETIRPNGYPKSDLAAHIHIHFWNEDLKTLHSPGELQFDEDPRMTPARRARSIADGYLISKNTGTPVKPVYAYTIIVN